ncbi:MAG: hypothetical protein COS84_07560 [Armatimonadetes bacterium CG07_land_8_20_14_0_80_40_9]|nr:MAG: hypothetical protein COS84_07560 [Armatimonadetes bacterium CG07_land_8_20_14_0_80_40_9]
MAVLLFGYDVEATSALKQLETEHGIQLPASWDAIKMLTQIFLLKMEEVHTQLEAPCTLFIVGRVLEENIDAFQKINKNKLFEIQQHTYSHLRLKTVVQENKDGIQVFPGGTLDEIKQEVNKTSELMKKHLDVDCRGLTAPYAYYQGLSDRPDILKILHDAGIQYIRSYGRNEHDWQPVSFDIQPFWYKPQGFPEILEFPFQGWLDVQWREEHGWKNTEGYLNYLKSCVDLVIEKDLIWGYGSHDWSSIYEDPDMNIIKEFIRYAKDRNLPLKTYGEYYRLASHGLHW